MADIAVRTIGPQSGPQEAALASSADIAIMGGAAGGGKTFALLLEALRYTDVPEFGAVIFRREGPQITNQGGLWDESMQLYPLVGAKPKMTTLEWKFPKGAKVRFAHMEQEKDRFAWDGSQVPLIGFDQLEHFAAIQFWYMLSRNRSACGVRPYIRATCNPVPEDDPIGGWLAQLLAWWIDQETGYPIWERSGVIRWFVRLDDVIEWADSKREILDRHPEMREEDLQPKSFTFIPSKLEHNQILMKADPGYKASLLAMPYVERERLLGGNWKVRPAAGAVFNKAWFEVVSSVPECQWVRGWDKAGTAGAGDFSAGVKIGRAADGNFFVVDVRRGQWSSLKRNQMMGTTAASDGIECEIEIEQEPGSAGKESKETSIRELAGYSVRARPATGDKVTRAGPFAAQCEAGKVKILKGAWNDAYLTELHNFPDGVYDDQVDASSVAFNRLSLRPAGLTFYGLEQAPTEAEQQQLEKERIAEAERVVRESIMAHGCYLPGVH